MEQEQEGSAIYSTSYGNMLVTIKSEPLDDTGDIADASINYNGDDGDFEIDSKADVSSQVASMYVPSKRGRKKGSTKMARKNPQHQDVMVLDEIKTLSDKLLIGLFADFSCNEITRNFTYTCFLMPNSCHEQCTSFGGDLRARSDMLRHLRQHLETLTQAYEDMKLGDEEFSAEPLPAMRRRLATAEYGGGSKTGRRGRPRNMPSEQAASSAVTPSPRSAAAGHSTRRKERQYSEGGNGGRTSFTQLRTPPKDRGSSNAGASSEFYGENDPAYWEDGVESGAEQDADASALPEPNDHLPYEDHDHGRSQEQQHQEQLLPPSLILLPRSQPYHDHAYTVVEGAAAAAGYGEVADDPNDIALLDDMTETSSRTDGCRLRYLASVSCPATEPLPPNNITVKLRQVDIPASLNTIIIPIVRYSGNRQAALAELSTNTRAAAAAKASAPLPWLQRQRLLARQKQQLRDEQEAEMEANLSSGGEDEATGSSTVENRPPAMRKFEGSSWEKRMALKCIRELRCKKKEDVMLMCKICENKHFTATATLMYHYRSHAGIKPFVCLICNTTFTRQHSLNYHMLIHNNQSRFTCKECGRKFRHPSHFKEHQRRHTGETPFHCTDCSLRFKTRNTYKRHLKTRHGKLLTMEGIRVLTHEEIIEMSTRVRGTDDLELEGDDDSDLDLEEGGITVTELDHAAEEDEDLSAVCADMA